MSTRLPHHVYRIVSSASGKADNKPQMVTLNVDGQFGNATDKRLQEYFYTTDKDGVISHQY